MTPEQATAFKLTSLSPIRMHLAWHENRSSYFSCRKESRLLHLRLHRLFIKAPTPVLKAVVDYAMKGDRRSAVIMRQMANLYFSNTQIEPEPLSSRGRVYDLTEIRDRIHRQYFIGQKDVAIGWSLHYRRGKFRSVTFGSYDRHRNQVRVNRVLDDETVPLYFLEFIVYHEMLHAICEPYMDAKGIIYSHTREFRDLEKRFLQFQEAKEWEKNSLTFFKKRWKDGRS